MTTSPTNQTDRLLDLLADRAVQGLSPREAAELDSLLRGESGEDASFDLSAAAANLALLGGRIEPMPASLRQELAALGRDWASGQISPKPDGNARTSSKPANADRWKFAATTGWLAAAAALVLAFAGWWMQGRSGPTPGESLLALRRLAPDLVSIRWAPGPSEAREGATGEVVWSPSRQEGFMVFQNMKPNDPYVEQYQLWVFDSKRDERFPVDGGVFNISSTGETIVAIRTAVRVEDATLFAVTIERPGGVVVSDRSRLPLLAQPKKEG